MSLSTSASRGVSGSSGGVSPAAPPATRRGRARAGIGVEERLAAHRRAARLDEVAVDAGLQHVARRPGPQRFEEVLLVVVHREHQQPDLGRAARRARAAAWRPVSAASRRRGSTRSGVELQRPVDGLGAVGGLGDDLEVGLGVEDARARRGGRPRGRRPPARGPSAGAVIAAGTSRRTRVPPPAARPTSGGRGRAARVRACRVMPRASSPTYGGTPRPSSSTVSVSGAVGVGRAQRDAPAPAWRATFVRASCATR